MGKMVLCSGSRAKRPYVFTSTGFRIYSIEELCYYINNNMCFMDEELCSDALINWIGSELKLDERAKKLKLLKDNRSDCKTILTVLLCSCDYYSEQEIKGILKHYDEMSVMKPIRRNFIRANNYLKKKQYSDAIGEYDRILNSKEAVGLTTEEYGDILHNLAIARIQVKGVKEAAETFKKAYERNQRKESLLGYIYTLKISNDKEKLNKKLESFHINNIVANELNKNMEQMYAEAKICPMMIELDRLKRLRYEGRISEYHKGVDSIIGEWITSVRMI